MPASPADGGDGVWRRQDAIDEYDVSGSLAHPKNASDLNNLLRGRNTSYAINRGLRTGSELLVLLPSGRGLPVSPQYGLFQGACDAASAASVDAYLCNQAYRNADGYLVVNGQAYAGYEGYNGIYEELQSGVQAMRSTKLHKTDDLQAVVPGVPGLLSLLVQILRQLGVSDPRTTWQNYLKGLHMLVDTEDGQVKFTWHEDVKDIPGRSKALLTAAVHCTANQTSCMQMWGFRPFVYDAQGAYVIFRGHAVHRSVPWVDRRGKRAAKAVRFGPTHTRHPHAPNGPLPALSSRAPLYIPTPPLNK